VIVRYFPGRVVQAPTASPSLSAPQEHDALRSVAGATSLEIQEAGEGSGVAQLPEPEEGDAQISDLVRISWVAAFEAGAHVDEDEESGACHSSSAGCCGRIACSLNSFFL
jgi:hypothetical protein